MSDKADESQLLFEITDKHLNTGLRGFPVGKVRTSRVDKMTGVSYVGRPIGELAEKDPEEVIFLLLNKRSPTSDELSAFKSEIASRGQVDQRVFALMRSLPKEGHPMEWFINGLTLLGMIHKTEDFYEDALNAMAKIPAVVAAVFRLRSGWGDIIEPKPELGLVENFVHMLGVPDADSDKLTSLLRTFYVLHMDHGGGNLSTFTGKAVASGQADMFASLAASMCGLYGPLHGRANQNCLAFVQEVGTSDHEELDVKLRALLSSGGKVAGFGHAVLRAEDPRATVQYALGAKICPDDPLFKIVVALREVAVGILKEIPKVSNPYPNVDAVSGSLLNASGLTDSNYYTVLFGLARCSGIAAQIVDERINFRNGRGVPIYRCSYKFEEV
jgi:citrate synthase